MVQSISNDAATFYNYPQTLITTEQSTKVKRNSIFSVSATEFKWNCDDIDKNFYFEQPEDEYLPESDELENNELEFHQYPHPASMDICNEQNDALQKFKTYSELGLNTNNLTTPECSDC